MDRDAIMQAVKGSRLGAGLGKDIVESLVDMAQPMDYDDGQAVVTAGDACDDMYLVVAGQARVDNTFAGQTRSVAMLKAGDYFGEVGLLGGGKRSSTVVAEGRLTCLLFPAQPMRILLDQFPAMKSLLEQAGTKRQTTNIELHLGEAPEDD